MTDDQKKPETGDDPAISRLYRNTRVEEPDALLDAKILAEAKAATHQRRWRWWLPLSSAAVVLLGITFTLKLMEQAPRLPQSVEEFSTERPVETEAVRRAEKKQTTPAPAMMMDSMPEPDNEAKAKLQKAAPMRSMPADSTLEMPRQQDGSEVLEHDRQDLKSEEILDNPVDWLAQIQRVLDRGERNRAVQELKVFIATYPEYPLPESLQRLDPD